MFIVGEEDEEFNDYFWEQLVGNVEVVIDVLVEWGVVDCNCIVVGGYFYGVFMMVNLLAYFDFFVVGIVCSGVYNWILIFFGF